MPFAVIGDPENQGCDCGISDQPNLGNIYFSKFGKELGDVIEGDLDCTLAGFKTCDCAGEDTNNDGKNDRWDVSCQNLHVHFHFKLVVGSKFYSQFLAPGNNAPSVINPEVK